MIKSGFYSKFINFLQHHSDLISGILISGKFSHNTCELLIKMTTKLNKNINKMRQSIEVRCHQPPIFGAQIMNINELASVNVGRQRHSHEAVIILI